MHGNLENIADPVGLVGVFIILIAYFLLSIDKWKADTIKYQIINLVGALLILFSLFYHWNLSSVVIEIAWAFISLIGIYRIIKKKSNNSGTSRKNDQSSSYRA